MYKLLDDTKGLIRCLYRRRTDDAMAKKGNKLKQLSTKYFKED